MGVTEFFDQAGPLGIVLLLLSVLALAIIITKARHFIHLRVRNLAFSDQALTALAGGDTDGARALMAASPNPVARVMEAMVESYAPGEQASAGGDAEVERRGEAELREMETWLRPLATVAHLSPLVGLLGTVFGMIRAFMAIEAAGSRVDPGLLAGGIWEALLTTAFGLAIAIPSLAAFHFFAGEIERVRAAMKDVTVRLMAACGVEPASSAVFATLPAAEREDYAV